MRLWKKPLTPALCSGQGKAWLAWYGMVWYGLLATNHPMRLVESRLLQNCMMGFSQILC